MFWIINNIKHLPAESRDTGTTKQKNLEAQVAALKLELSNTKKTAESSRREAVCLKDKLERLQILLQTKEHDLEDKKESLKKTDLELTGARLKLDLLQKEQKELGLIDLNIENL